MKILLTTWAARNMERPPHINTLRAWAGAGLFDPPAEKMGRTWFVDEDAKYSPSAPEIKGVSDRVAEILRRTA